MSAVNGFAYVYLAYLSQPASDRAVYRLIRHQRIRNIVEIGMGLGVRAKRMIRVAQRRGPDSSVRYTGIDPFESRTAADDPGLTLKLAYRMLAATGARIRLLPGEPEHVLRRAANAHLGTDLILLSAGWPPETLGEAWPFVPRMLHESSILLVEEDEPASTKKRLRRMSADEIGRLAASQRPRRAA